MRTEPKLELVAWPEPGDRWRDTGEGGLYAFLVIPADDTISRSTGGCCVCTYTYLTRPEICVTPGDAIKELWEDSPEWGQEDSTKVHNARQKLEAAGHKDTADSLTNLIGYDQLSIPLAVSIFLGATSNALLDEKGDAYFHVQPQHLTAAGLDLYGALEKTHDHPPQILTFLDT